MIGGRLRHRVIIEQPDDSRSASGAIVKGWVEFASRWASIQPIRARETFQSKEFISEVTHQVKVRYLEGLTNKMRLVFGTRTFDILEVLNVDERNRELVLSCKEGLSQGN